MNASVIPAHSLMVIGQTKNIMTLFTLLFITEAMYLCPPMAATKRELKVMARDLLNNMRNESICTHVEPPAVPHAVGCLTEANSNVSECERVSLFSTYVTEATDLDINSVVTERLEEINQYLQSIQNVLCRSEPELMNCTVAFKESDGDYENICKLMSLLEILTLWLSKDNC